MEDLIFRISKNHIFGLGSIISLGVATYLIKRYLSNEKSTTNNYYLKTEENIAIPNLKLTVSTDSTNSTSPLVVYIFWNGDVNSTYLLIDQLLQDKVIQPLYIERYTILKALEHNTLEKLTATYNHNKSGCDAKTLEYLADVARLKRKQSKELTQLEFIRKMILKQYPEFNGNFLPTQYITTITKDLAQTQAFFDQLQNFQHLDYKGIEFFEQALRYVKYVPSLNGRVLLGYNKDSRLMKILKKMENSIILQNKRKIEIPLQHIDNQAIRYLATEIVKNDVMRVLLD
jgi:hypothetical protein